MQAFYSKGEGKKGHLILGFLLAMPPTLILEVIAKLHFWEWRPGS
jgi:hypothetical protein